MSLLVNGEYLDDSVIRQEASLVRAQLLEAMPDEDPLTIDMRAWEWARENVIERVLLRQAALTDIAPLAPDVVEKAIQQVQAQSPGRSGFPMAGGDQAFREQVEIGIRVEHFVARLTANVARPANKEIADYYREHRDSFYAPDAVHAAHIVKNVDEQMDDATALAAITVAETELRSGRGFAEVADEHSDCPGRGGDLGWIARGQMVDEFDAVAFALDAGKSSGIFRSPFGYHIAAVSEKRLAGIRPLAEVRDHIEQGIYARRREEAVEQFVDEFRARADIRKAP
jgi:parvulin-like peptidyl-prolyl isomerase